MIELQSIKEALRLDPNASHGAAAAKTDACARRHGITLTHSLKLKLVAERVEKISGPASRRDE